MTGHSEHLAPLVRGAARRDERTGAQSRLDDDSAQRQPGNNAVTPREVITARLEAWGELADEAALGGDIRVQLLVLRRINVVEAARKHERVVQVGLQRRSSPVNAEACEFIRKGGIGKVTAVRAFHVQNEWPKGIGNPANEDPPKDFDWEAWLGPAPKVPYNKNRAFYRFRWFYDYSGGQLTNFGVHYLDLIHWALGQDTPLDLGIGVERLAGRHVRSVPAGSSERPGSGRRHPVRQATTRP